MQNRKLQEKFHEALTAILPVVGIVLILSFTVAPITPSILLSFLLGALMVMVGMMFFTLGAEVSMTPMGEKVGAIVFSLPVTDTACMRLIETIEAPADI
ncbi:MAG: DUF1538 family protein [Oscillospiraceae bacterium]|nr:DUF1538 family protein [Oscillospiraceae bacterium]